MRGAVNHTDLTVTDVEKSFPLYNAFLTELGYLLVRREPHVAEWNLNREGFFTSIGIANATTAQAHNRYAPGLHHLAFTSDTREDVDRMFDRLKAVGAEILDPPAEYPEYGPGSTRCFLPIRMGSNWNMSTGRSAIGKRVLFADLFLHHITEKVCVRWCQHFWGQPFRHLQNAALM